MYGDQQVGFANVDGHTHACLWHNTASSWVDIHPAGATESRAYGVYDGRQVGYARIDGPEHASVWSGTADSWVDLHALLPSGEYDRSSGESVYVSGSEVWVVGTAFTTSNQPRAMLWHYIPDPTISGIAPYSGLNTGIVTITDLAGAYFQEGAAMRLTKPGETDIVATDVAVLSSTKITCTLNLDGKALGEWSVIVTNPDGLSGTLTDGFTILAPISVGSAKDLPMGSAVCIQDTVVTAPNLEAGSVFVESSDRSTGIKLISEQALSLGDRIMFIGTIDRVDGEYVIVDTAFEDITAGLPLDPIMMTTPDIGSDKTQMLNYEAVDTSGLLVAIAGTVTATISTQGVVYVDDGGNYQDGLGPFIGLRVHIPAGVTIPVKNKRVVITGISRVEKHTLTDWGEVNGDWYPPGTVVYVPTIWARDVGDIRIY